MFEKALCPTKFKVFSPTVIDANQRYSERWILINLIFAFYCSYLNWIINRLKTYKLSIWTKSFLTICGCKFLRNTWYLCIVICSTLTRKRVTYGLPFPVSCRNSAPYLFFSSFLQPTWVITFPLSLDGFLVK